jgi:hypothetical protein
MILQNLADSITFIPDETNFWFVRTMSGDFFEDYLTNGFIALGYNDHFRVMIIRIVNNEFDTLEKF